MKKLLFTVALLLSTTAFAKGKIQNEDVKSLSELTSAGGTMSQLINDSKIYITANSINQQLSTAIQSGLIGGGGGASGIQLLQNPGFEIGVSTGWSSTGSFTAISSGSNLLVGTGSATFQSTASGQLVTSSLYAIPNGLKGRSCAASILYLGADANYFLTVSDGTNTIASQQMAPSIIPTPLGVTFQCPSSGSLELQIVSVASGAIMALDQMFLGENTISQVSQANFVGDATFSGGACEPAVINSSFQTFSSAACTVVTTGAAVVPGGGSPAPVVNIPNAPPGDYYVVFTGAKGFNNLSYTTDIRLFEVTTSTVMAQDEWVTNFATATPLVAGETLAGHVVNPTTQNLSFVLQGQVTASSTTLQGGTTPFRFVIYRFPSQSELVVRPETQNWVAGVSYFGSDVDISAAGGFSELSSGGVGSATLIPGSSPDVMVPCGASAGPIAPGGSLTCSSGSPSLGIVFNVPAAGTVQVCVTFANQLNLGATSQANNLFELAETPVSDGTTFLQGINGPNLSGLTTSSPSNTINLIPVSLCENMVFTSAGQKAVRLISSTPQRSGTINRNSVALGGNNAAKFTARPITQNLPNPVFIGSVTQPVASSSIDVVTRALLGIGSSPPIITQNGNWIQSYTQNATGNYEVTFTPGTFSEVPTCTCSIETGSISGQNAYICTVDTNNTTLAMHSYNAAGAALADPSAFGLICVGPR